MVWTWKPLIDRAEVRREFMEKGAESIRDFTVNVRNDPSFRGKIVAGYAEWLGYFRNCALNPVLFRSDPSLIERFLAALEIDAESLGRDEFPPLHSAVEELRAIAAETSGIRRSIAAENVGIALRLTQKRPLA